MTVNIDYGRRASSILGMGAAADVRAGARTTIRNADVSRAGACVRSRKAETRRGEMALSERALSLLMVFGGTALLSVLSILA